MQGFLILGIIGTEKDTLVFTLRGLTTGFISGSQCWYFSHDPSSLFYHSV